MKLFKSISLILLVAVIMMFTVSARADMMIKQATHTDSFKGMGGPDQPVDDTSTMWIAGDKAAIESNDGKIIIRDDEGMLYIVDNKAKTYNKLSYADLGDVKKLMGVEDMDPEQAAMMEQQMQMAMQMMQMTVTVTPTEETKEIKGYNCKKYDIDIKMGMADIKSEAWVTDKIKFDYNLFKKLNMGRMMMMPGADEAMKELEKVKGFTVLSKGTMTAMGQSVNTTTELVEAKEGDAPAGIYTVPEDFKEKKFNIMNQ